MEIAIIGAGNVGSALGKGWARTGHRISYGVSDTGDSKYRARTEAIKVGSVSEVVQEVSVVVLAVPFASLEAVLASAGDLSGRMVIDVTNPLRMGSKGLELSMGFSQSAGEHVASLAPRASVFKTLNQVGYELMEDTTGYPVKPIMFVAGDDELRKPTVMELVSDLGFDAVDAGGLAASRLLEPFGTLWIHLAVNRKLGRDNAFAYLRHGRTIL